MQLLRVRDNRSYRDVTYRKKYPTWDLRDKSCPWESFDPLPNHCLVPVPKKQDLLRCIPHRKQRATPVGR